MIFITNFIIRTTHPLITIHLKQRENEIAQNSKKPRKVLPLGITRHNQD